MVVVFINVLHLNIINSSNFYNVIDSSDQNTRQSAYEKYVSAATFGRIGPHLCLPGPRCPDARLCIGPGCLLTTCNMHTTLYASLKIKIRIISALVMKIAVDILSHYVANVRHSLFANNK